MEQKINVKSEQREKMTQDGVIITDMLANLCTELAMLFKSLSRITQTCLGLKEHLYSPTTSFQQPSTSQIIPSGDCHVKRKSETSEAVNSKVVNPNK